MSAPAEKPVTIAVAGTGAMARYHVQRFRAFPHVEVVGCYDRKADRAQAFAAEAGIAMAADTVEGLLDRSAPDGLTVASADAEQHYAVSAALERDIPLFVEKPFGTSSAEAAELAALQRERDVPVLVNFSKLNFPAIWGLVQLVETGGLGAPRSVELSYLQSWIVSTVWGRWWEEPRWLWRISSHKGGGGAARDLGSHLFYLLFRLGGAATLRSGRTEIRADRSAAAESGASCDLNDTFTAELALSSGATATVHASYAAPDYVNYLYARVVGERGEATVHAEKEKSTLELTRPHGTAPRPVRFGKVFSTYDLFLSRLSADAEHPADALDSSAEKTIHVHRIIEGLDT
jgi:predicted dehydrogenase